MQNKLFFITKTFITLVVISSFLAAISLYIAVVFLTYNVISDFFSNFPFNTLDVKSLVVKFFKILDMSLIAITFQVVSLGIYRLFINNNIPNDIFSNTLKIKNIHDLKSILLQVSVVILVVMFLENVVEIGAGIDIFYLGASISLVIFSAVLSWKFMK